MSLLKTIKQGRANLAEWLGEGGKIVGRAEAQARADVCLKGNSGKPCPNNVPLNPATKAIALAIKTHLAIKNSHRLRVEGEKSLHHCRACSCVLRLQVWLPQEMVVSQLTDEELPLLPLFCWKLKP